MVTGTSTNYTITVYKTLEDAGKGFSAELTALQKANVVSMGGEYGSMVKKVDGGFQLGAMCKLGHIGVNGNSDQYGFHPDAMKGGPWFTFAHRHPGGGKLLPSGTDITSASKYQADGKPNGSILATVDGRGMIFRPRAFYESGSLNSRSREMLKATYYVDTTW